MLSEGEGEGDRIVVLDRIGVLGDVGEASRHQGIEDDADVPDVDLVGVMAWRVN